MDETADGTAELADAGTTPATTHGVGGPAPDTSTALIGATSASNTSSAAGGPLPDPVPGAEPSPSPSPESAAKSGAEPAGDVPSIQQLAPFPAGWTS